MTAKETAGNGPAWFEVKAKNGLIYEYGGTVNSRAPLMRSLMLAARAGRAVPGNIRGVVTAAEHNLGAVSANSPFTSWTTELSVARHYAGENGLILRVPVGAPPPATLRKEIRRRKESCERS